MKRWPQRFTRMRSAVRHTRSVTLQTMNIETKHCTLHRNNWTTAFQWNKTPVKSMPVKSMPVKSMPDKSSEGCQLTVCQSLDTSQEYASQEKRRQLRVCQSWDTSQAYASQEKRRQSRVCQSRDTSQQTLLVTRFGGGSILVSMLDSQSRGWDSTPTNRTLSVGIRTAWEKTGHPPPFIKARKMKSPTLHTHVCLNASLRDSSSSSSRDA